MARDIPFPITRDDLNEARGRDPEHPVLAKPYVFTPWDTVFTRTNAEARALHEAVTATLNGLVGLVWRCLYCGDPLATGATCEKPGCVEEYEAARRRMGVS